MMVDWSPLRHELASWRRDGLTLPLWWRDDDAVAPGAALDRLMELGAELAVPVHLAVIPKDATEALADTLSDGPPSIVLVHGWAHENHAPTGAKKAEFGHPRDRARVETADALARMSRLFAPRLLPMFVPPWNRIAPEIMSFLAGQGYTALSTFTPRSGRSVAGLIRINTHVDPIYWKAGGGLMPPDQLLVSLVALLHDRRTGATDAAEPLGFLSHHLVHDDAIWEFTRTCLAELLEAGALPCNLLKMKDALP